LINNQSFATSSKTLSPASEQARARTYMRCTNSLPVHNQKIAAELIATEASLTSKLRLVKDADH
jgi:hypothetical protein